MIKRILSIFALATMIFVTSCSKPITLMEFLPEDLGTTDFGETTILWGWQRGSVENGFYELGTPQYDFLMTKIEEIEAKFNCDIEPIIGDVNMEATKVKLMSGAQTYDILTAGEVSNLATGGLLYSLSDLSEYIDLSNTTKFGPLTSQEGFMYNGEVYGATFALWPGFEPMAGHIIAYNRDLFKENNLTDLHEYYENGTWTYDTFENDFIAKTSIQNKDGENLTILTTHESNLYEALVHSNQVKFVERQADGTLVANPYSQSFVNAMTWGENLVDTYKDKIKFEDSRELASYRNQSSISALCYTAAFTTGNIAYNDISVFESGIMPFPCGPNATYGEWTACMGNIYGFMIPITSLNAEASAMIMNELAEPFDEFGGDAGLIEYYKSNIFMNELDAEIFAEIAKHTSYTYETVAGSLGREVSEAFCSILENKNSSMTYGFDRYRDILTELIEVWMIPNYNAVYGE